MLNEPLEHHILTDIQKVAFSIVINMIDVSILLSRKYQIRETSYPASTRVVLDIICCCCFLIAGTIYTARYLADVGYYDAQVIPAVVIFYGLA
jgi:hypothetical protein